MRTTNRFTYRAQILCDLLDDNPASERFAVIAEAFALQMEKAFQAMVAETAEGYQIKDTTLSGLQQLQPAMLEVRLLGALDQDPSSWLNQLRQFVVSQSEAQQRGALSTGSQGSSMSIIATLDRTRDKDWYTAVLEQWQSLMAQVRQASVHE